MPYCKNCGQSLTSSANFCTVCGTPCNDAIPTKSSQETTYEGEIHICPSCGKRIDSFVSICPACGNEFRGATVSQSVKEFAEKLEKVNNVEQEINLIKNYPIPNTNEDILEFLILVSTNITGDLPKSLFDAWKAKFEQCYHKAELLFANGNRDTRILTISDQINKKIKKAKLAQITKSIENKFKSILNIIPNPVLRIVCLLLFVFEIVQIISLNFSGFDIIFCAIILVTVYNITEKTVKTKKNSTDVFSGKTIKEKNEIKKIRIPSIVRNEESKNYEIIELALLQAGFTNVMSVPLHDLVFDVLMKQGTVKSITINGKDISSYFIYKFVPDIPIIITYHSFR